jgi:hypothetical protein
MNRARTCLLHSLSIAAFALVTAPAAHAQAGAHGVALNQSSYQLVSPLPLPSLAPGADSRWRIETAAGLGERHQLRLTTNTSGLASPFGGGSTYFDSRATWRYTVYEHANWAWRLGLTSALGDREPHALSTERARFGSLPQLHLAGEGSVARRWLVGFDADGLMTPRGRGFELGLRVSYLLAPNFSVIGGYRLTEAGGEGEDLYGPGFSNSANVGLRLRF